MRDGERQSGSDGGSQDPSGQDRSEDEERSVLTARLMLRPPRTDDAAALAAAIDNPRVAMNLVTVPYPYRRADAEAWIDRERAAITGPGATRIAICRSESNLIGMSAYRPSDSRPDGFDLSFWVAERFWGRGYGTEIAHAAIDHAFGGGGIDRLWSAVRVTNGSARRVVEKCGFQFRDAGMVRSIATRGAVPVERFVLEKRVWRSLKAWGSEGRAWGSEGKERGSEGKDRGLERTTGHEVTDAA